MYKDKYILHIYMYYHPHYRRNKKRKKKNKNLVLNKKLIINRRTLKCIKKLLSIECIFFFFYIYITKEFKKIFVYLFKQNIQYLYDQIKSIKSAGIG